MAKSNKVKLIFTCEIRKSLENDRLWMITVGIGFSLLVLLAYVIVLPMTHEEGIIEKTDDGLKAAIEKFQQLKEKNSDSADSNLET